MIEGLDPNVWSGLRELPTAACVELIDLYLETTPTLLAELRIALDAGDVAVFRALVHQLKGSSSSLGVQALQHLCGELDQQGRAGTLTDLATALQRIEVAHGHGVQALAAQRASLGVETR